MPLVPMVLPALAAFSIAGIARVVDPMPWLIFVFLAGWATVAWVVQLETAPDAITLVDAPEFDAAGHAAGAAATSTPTVRLRPRRRAEFDLPVIVAEPVVVNTPELPPHPRPLAVRTSAFALAFFGFIAAGALVPGGLALDRQAPTTMRLLALALLNGGIAGLVGYRMAALTSPHRFDRIVRIVAIGQYALPVAIATAALRTLALPRLFIPALLAIGLYALTGVRESPAPVPQNLRLVQELAVLGLAAIAAIAWGMVLR
jgi:hypothetical protein